MLEALLESPEIVVEDADAARRALSDWREAGTDFADALIGHRNARAGCRTTLGFDKAVAKHPLFSAP